MKRILLFVAACAASLVVAAPPAMAAETVCVGVLSGGVFETVVVPENEICTLLNSEVSGNVFVEEGAQFFARGSRIGGNVKADDAMHVSIFGPATNIIEGNILIKGLTGTLAGFSLCGSQVGGNVRVTDSDVRFGIILGGAPCAAFGGGNTIEGNVQIRDNVISGMFGLFISGNVVGNNMQVDDNAGPLIKEVHGNVIEGNLRCRDNEPPFVGGPNVARKSDGQCF